MDLNAIVEELKSERDRLSKAIAAFEGVTSTRVRSGSQMTTGGRRAREKKGEQK